LLGDMVFGARNLHKVGSSLSLRQGHPFRADGKPADVFGLEFPGKPARGQSHLPAIIPGLLIIASAIMTLWGDVAFGAVGVEASDATAEEVLDGALRAAGPFAGYQ